MPVQSAAAASPPLLQSVSSDLDGSIAPSRLDADVRFMRLALAEAARGLAAGELPIGAVVVAGDGEVLAAAHTNERATGRLLVHAELRALQAADARGRWPGGRRAAALYTTCEPCLMCLGAAASSFLGRVVYGHDAPGDGAAALVAGWRRDEAAFPAYRPPAIGGGVLAGEGLALMRGYVASATPGPLRDWAARIAGSGGDSRRSCRARARMI